MATSRKSAPQEVCHIDTSEYRLSQFLRPEKIDLPKNPRQLARAIASPADLVSAINSIPQLEIIPNATTGKSVGPLWME